MKFLLKVVLFAAPIILVLAFPVWVLYRSGELMPDNEIVARMTVPGPNPTLVGLAYTNPSIYLSHQLVLAKKLEVLVLGSSHISAIRSYFFTPTTTLYVVSHFQEMSDFQQFVDAIPASAAPRLIVLGLDQRFFDPGYASGAQDDIQSLLSQPFGATDVLVNWSAVYRDYFDGKFTIAQIFSAPTSSIGLSAVANDAGYRVDGSHQNGDVATSPTNPAAPDYEFRNSFSEIAEGVAGFEHSNTVYQPALDELAAFLADCRSRNIAVVGLMPPFAPDVYQKMESLPDEYGYLKVLPAAVNAVFASNGFSLYDFTNPASVAITDAEMQDGTHTTERGSMQFVFSMATQSAALRQYVDPTYLEARLASTTGQYDLDQ